MVTLTDFLLARLAEDDREAQRALSTLTNEINHARLLNLTSTREEILAAPHLGAPLRRMFAEVEAKRQIVERHNYPPARPTRHSSQQNMCYEDADDMPCSTLRIVAAVYADHPDFQEEWRLT